MIHWTKWFPGADVVRHYCPIETCPWFHDEPQQPGVVSIPVVDGRCDVDAMVGERVRRVDDKVKAHAGTHTTEQWAAEIGRMRHVIDMWEQGYGNHVRGRGLRS